jgi:hypothetical protein
MGFPLPEFSDGLNEHVRKLLAGTLRITREKGRETVKTDYIIRPVWQADRSVSPLELYANLIRLAQDWIARYPLWETAGNFGSIDGDAPCGMRYNEVGPSKWMKYFTESNAGSWRSGFPQLLANGGFAHSGQIETDAPDGTEADPEFSESELCAAGSHT